MNQVATVTMKTAKIHEQEGFNARTHKDPGSLERLAASIARDGVLEPLLVQAGEDGGATVIAGHRRLAAARKARLHWKAYSGTSPTRSSVGPRSASCGTPSCGSEARISPAT